ncbi:MAG: acyl-ACP--UDP-N-acetylglucosamine O-acyltransferase [Phycisphaerales bacterium]|nr:acyl-ACP--UDP-N-acetylglucosamine O-acyltransferase [Phycisphaerales bacterium]
MSCIHPTAIIHDSAQLGENVQIGAFSIVGPDVEIGDGCVLMEHVHVNCNTIMGRENTIHPFTALGGEPQDRKFHGERTVLRLGDRNDIREHVTMHRGTGNGGGETVIGSDCLVMVGSHVAHDCIIGDHVTIANQVMLAGHVIMGDGSAIGGGAGVHHYATIGRLAFVGGMARVARDVPPFVIVEGHPAEVRAVNTIGLVRAGVDGNDIDQLKACFKRLFRDAAPAKDRLPDLRAAHTDTPIVLELCDAIEAAGDGTHGRAREAVRRDDRWSRTR